MCITYNNGAVNRRSSSSGSVNPTRNETNDTEKSKPAINFFLSFEAALYIASEAAGNPNIINKYFPVINLV